MRGTELTLMNSCPIVSVKRKFVNKVKYSGVLCKHMAALYVSLYNAINILLY